MPLAGFSFTHYDASAARPIVGQLVQLYLEVLVISEVRS